MALHVGIIGLGKIGRACASNLITDGFTVCALSRPSTVDFVDDGGHLCADTAELSATCDVIITCLASEAQMNDAFHGANGLIAYVRAGQTVVEMGTFPAALKKPLADALAAKGVPMLDCPISGVPATVLQRAAILFVSGRLQTHLGGSLIRPDTSNDYNYRHNSNRRALYWPVLRNSLPELFRVFDFANPSMVTGRRESSATTPQALFLMNNPWVITQADPLFVT